MYIPQLDNSSINFPDPHDANKEGIVAWGGDLNPARLYNAYLNGIFPWYSRQDPILWWSTDPRLIMELDEFKLRKSLRKKLKKFTYKFDEKFEEVVHKCATVKRKEQNGTWINQELIDSLNILYENDLAHSVEAYQDGELVGGLYGIIVGKVFCGESMFAEVSDASKAAYAILVRHLKAWGYDFIDCQVPTEHLKYLGAKEVSRDYYLERLYKVNMETIDKKWEIEEELIN